MDSFRQKQVVCRTTLAPSVAKEKNAHTLGAFHAPARGNERDGDAAHNKKRLSGFVKAPNPSVIVFNPLQRIRKLTSETMTDDDAERIVYPFHSSAITTPFEQVLMALMDKLASTVDGVTWNKPAEHAEWQTDLRFFGSWWIVIQRKEDAATKTAAPLDPHPSGRRSHVSWIQGMHGEPLITTSTTTLLQTFHGNRQEHQYAPLLRKDATVADENALIADLARRLGGPIDHLDIFHLSGLVMTPDRLHVLLFDGFSKLVPKKKAAPQSSEDLQCQTQGNDGGRGEAPAPPKPDEVLSTVSFSACQVSSAGAVVLMTGVAYLAAQGLDTISALDLSYNDLQSASLYSFTQLLRFTFIKRLSLRGNTLASVDVIPFREFLLEGCERQIEELDLSYTELTAAQVAVLVEALPRLYRLRVLLLEEVTIPASKWPSLVRAVERTKLWHLRLASAATLTASSTAIAAYARTIDDVCARNARCATEAKAAAAASAAFAGFFGLNTSSFFEAFFHFSQLKGNRIGDEESALPDGYGAFTNNDPSLL